MPPPTVFPAWDNPAGIVDTAPPPKAPAEADLDAPPTATDPTPREDEDEPGVEDVPEVVPPPRVPLVPDRPPPPRPPPPLRRYRRFRFAALAGAFFVIKGTNILMPSRCPERGHNIPTAIMAVARLGRRVDGAPHHRRAPSSSEEPKLGKLRR